MDASLPYRLDPAVALRPEPFGALAYHYGTRRLVFLRATELVDLVEDLHNHPSADAALDRAPSGRREPLRRALDALEKSGIVSVR